jgi:hypothetical protein
MQPLHKTYQQPNVITNEAYCVVELKRAVAEAHADFCSDVVRYFARRPMECRVKSDESRTKLCPVIHNLQGKIRYETLMHSQLKQWN